MVLCRRLVLWCIVVFWTIESLAVAKFFSFIFQSIFVHIFKFVFWISHKHWAIANSHIASILSLCVCKHAFYFLPPFLHQKPHLIFNSAGELLWRWVNRTIFFSLGVLLLFLFVCFTFAKNHILSTVCANDIL